MIEQDKLEDLTKNINRYVKTNLDLIRFCLLKLTQILTLS